MNNNSMLLPKNCPIALQSQLLQPTLSIFTGRYSMEPSKATTSPVVGRWSFIMPKRMAIDSILGLKEILKNVNSLFKNTPYWKVCCVDLAYSLLNLRITQVRRRKWSWVDSHSNPNIWQWNCSLRQSDLREWNMILINCFILAVYWNVVWSHS